MSNPSLFNKNSKRSLVLAGGGMRLAYHAGVVKAIEEHGLNFSHVDGTSGGIFGTAMLASDLSPTQIQQNWRKVKHLDFMSGLPLRKYLQFGRLSAMGDADGITEKVFPKLGVSVAKINANTQFEATFNVCNFSTKEIESIDGQSVTQNHLIAGMSLPIFMPALKIGQHWYTDAVWVKDANVMEAVKRGAEEIYLVYCIGNSRQYFNGSFLQYVHMIEMSAAGGLLAEFDWLKLVNQQIADGKSPYGQSKAVKIKVIKPPYPLPLDPDLFMGKVNFRSLINMGYAHSHAQLSDKSNDWQSLDYNASLMQEPGASLQFPVTFQSNTQRIFLHFDFRLLTDNQYVNQFYGSILDVNSGEEFCFFNTTLELHTGKILLNASYNSTHSICIEIPISNQWEFNFGLTMKQAKVTIDNAQLVEYSQNISSRLLGQINSKLYHNSGFWNKQKLKNTILRHIFRG